MKDFTLGFISLAVALMMYNCSLTIGKHNTTGVNVGGTQTVIAPPSELNNYIQYVTTIKEGDRNIYYPNSITNNFSTNYINENITYHESHLQSLKDEKVRIESDSIENKIKFQQGKIKKTKYLQEKNENSNRLKDNRSKTEKFKRASTEWQKLLPKTPLPSDKKPQPEQEGERQVIPLQPRIEGGSHMFKQSEVGFEFNIVILNGTTDYPNPDGSYFANPIKSGDKITFKNTKTNQFREFQY
ncbi:MAG: hypothetical protein JNM22_12445 [Saprospiraceae bacterium]|nr:hypothetical protein [Saprospiraceae bacterium]